jgi:hypothetical protein
MAQIPPPRSREDTLEHQPGTSDYPAMRRAGGIELRLNFFKRQHSQWGRKAVGQFQSPQVLGRCDAQKRSLIASDRKQAPLSAALVGRRASRVLHPRRHNGWALAYAYFEEKPVVDRRPSCITKDEARWIAKLLKFSLCNLNVCVPTWNLWRGAKALRPD